MKYPLTKIRNPDSNSLLYKEWLVTNGLGGFASGSISFAPMRKYHALLIASLSAPFGRTLMLNYVADAIVLSDQREISLSLLRHENDGPIENFPLTEFRLDKGLPKWRYEIEDIIIEKYLIHTHLQNTLHMTYHLISSKESIQIKWRPYLHFRPYESPVDFTNPDEIYSVHSHDHHYEIECPPYPILRLYNANPSTFILDIQKEENVYYGLEAARGYTSLGHLTSPGYYNLKLYPGEKTTFVASTESWQNIHALSSDEAWLAEKLRRKNILKAASNLPDSETISKLVFSADQFIIVPASRHEDIIRLQAAGEQAGSIIAGYPWFTDWGRDTMISLEGLTITPGREKLTHSILRTFAFYVKDGLIPNMFPDGKNQGLYNTADATLWFFHAVDRYIEATGDKDILNLLLPKFHHIINAHIKGTHFGIKVDDDGLLCQGQEGIQLTWMDAKVDNWVVTPRRGKAVEINGLWYNALKLMESWTNQKYEITEKCFDSFNKKFWYAEGQYLYDVVEGENVYDSSLRPNQLFSISLKNPVLEQKYWQPVLESVRKNLLTPVGLRTLAPSDPNFKSHYDGDILARDAAYHQGTVWPWLLGSFIDVWFKVYPDDIESAQKFLSGLDEHLETDCIGSINEIFDAFEPYKGRGCFAQAWSVAELLRCKVKIDNLARIKRQSS